MVENEFSPLFGTNYISLILIKEEMTWLKVEQSTFLKHTHTHLCWSGKCTGGQHGILFPITD